MEFLTQFANPAFLTPVGLLAVVVILIITGKLAPWPRINELNKEVEHQRGTIDSLTKSLSIITKGVEAQNQTSEIIKAVMGALQRENRDRGDKP